MSERRELWSPNCPVIPSYPGIRPRGLALLEYFGYRLLDSSLGRFNPGFYPQVLSNESIHYTFFLRPPCSLDALAIVENCAEWACLTAYWIPDICNIGTGRVHERLLDGLRQRCTQIEHLRSVQCQHFHDSRITVSMSRDYCHYPGDRDVEWFDKPMLWEDAVDGVVRLQPAIKEKIAYYYYYKTITQPDIILPPQNSTQTAIPHRYMGKWVSTLSQSNVNIHLQALVPVFIIHTYMLSVDFGQDVSDNRHQFDRRSLYARADFSLSEPFNRLFRTNVALVDIVYRMPTPLPNPGSLSGSWMQGHRRQLGKGYDWPPSPPESVGEDDNDDLPPMLAPQTTPLPFVEPPPVAEASGPRNWQCWTEESNDLDNIDEGMLQPISKTQGNLSIQNGDWPYYDRENKHMLFITLEPKYDFGHEQWGQPFPKTYRFPVNIKKPTLWVYPTGIPVKGWWGRVQTNPPQVTNHAHACRPDVQQRPLPTHAPTNAQGSLSNSMQFTTSWVHTYCLAVQQHPLLTHAPTNTPGSLSDALQLTASRVQDAVEWGAPDPNLQYDGGVSIVVATNSSSSVAAATCYLVQTPLTQFTTAKKMISQQLGSRSARTTASLQTSGSVMFT